MKLISFERAQVLQPFVADEFRPEHDFYIPRLYNLAHQRYGFLSASDQTKAAAEGVKFQHGRLEFEGSEIAIQNLDVYIDGILANCRTSREADIVIDDAAAWLASTFGFRIPQTMTPRTYTSWLTVEFSASTTALFKNFSKVQHLVAETYAVAHQGAKLAFDLARLSLRSDPPPLSQFVNTDFIIDRRINVPYSQNRFFCGAPLKTQAHLQFLEKLEALIEASAGSADRGGASGARPHHGPAA